MQEHINKSLPSFNKLLKKRAHRDQPVLPACPHDGALGLRADGQGRSTKRSISEMKHADKLMKRIPGARRTLPNLPGSPAELAVGETVVECLAGPIFQLETEARTALVA